MIGEPSDPSAARASAERIIEEFAAACPVPTPQDVAEWQRKHVQHAAAIAEYADAMHLAASHELDDADERSIASSMARHGWAMPLDDLVEHASDSIPSVAEAIDIDRGVLAGIIAGRVHPPVAKRLVDALAVRLRRDTATVTAAVQASHAMPRVGHAFSRVPPERSSIGFREAVETSGMSAERKAYWLGDD